MMNDLQDAIVTTSIKAFNEGFARGVAAERDRLTEIIEELLMKLTNGDN
jgi:hypothetical protein